MGFCYCSMFCCTLLYVHSSIAIILMGKRELVALLNLSPWCLLMVEWLYLAVPLGCLQFLIVVFPDHTHYFFVAQSFKQRLWLYIINFIIDRKYYIQVNDYKSPIFQSTVGIPQG